MAKRCPIVHVALAALVPVVAQAAQGTYPERPIRIIVPQGAGGSTDLTARVVGERLGVRAAGIVAN